MHLKKTFDIVCILATSRLVTHFCYGHIDLHILLHIPRKFHLKVLTLLHINLKNTDEPVSTSTANFIIYQSYVLV